jgi:hypothetical protein
MEITPASSTQSVPFDDSWPDAYRRLRSLNGEVVDGENGSRQIGVAEDPITSGAMVYYVRTGNPMKTVCYVSPAPGQALEIRFGAARAIVASLSLVAVAFLALPILTAVYLTTQGEATELVVATSALFGAISIAALLGGVVVARMLLSRERGWREQLRQMVLEVLQHREPAG